MTRAFLLAAVAALLSGCASLDGITFDNRVACTAAKDRAYVVSEWGGRIGISSVIAEKDREVICK